MSTADKLQRLRQTKKDIKAAIEYKIGEIGDIPFSEYAYRLAPEIIQHPKMVGRYSTKGKANADADRAILKDLSGNGNDILLNNFAFSGMSGYGGFTQNYLNHTQSNATFTCVSTDSKTVINKAEGSGTWGFGVSSITYNNVAYDISADLSKLSGGTIELILVDTSTYKTIDKQKISQGINHIRPFTGFIKDAKHWCYISWTDGFYGQITIEQLPLYPDGLVFDGVDDLAKCAKAIPMKTIIMKARILSTNDCIFFDQRKNGIKELKFAGLNQKNSIAYNSRNEGGSTYINGVLNTTQTCAELGDKDIVIAMTNDGVTEIAPFTIGGTVTGDYLSIIVLYDFIGYTEVLAQEQIQSETKNYNL